MAFTVQLSQGSREKLSVEVPGPQCTVAELKELVCDLTSIQPSSQKIIFKGKTLQNGDETLEQLKINSQSKMILLGRKNEEPEEESVKEIGRIGKAVDSIEGKINEIEEELDGIEKGFLQVELVAEACRGLHKRCIACSELLMQNTEKLDAVEIPVAETLIRNKRKNAIKRIQKLLERIDNLIKRVDQRRTARK